AIALGSRGARQGEIAALGRPSSSRRRLKEAPAMFIALGLIGVLWFVGAVVVPDKGGPGVFGKEKPAVEVSQSVAQPGPAGQR
ncbi:MAG TPA: hypothetical protein VFA22_08530, partial [Stellaceae bacterium]|nr:hypothetical protein [Stellaceae bacterium]